MTNREFKIGWTNKTTGLFKRDGNLIVYYHDINQKTFTFKLSLEQFTAIYNRLSVDADFKIENTPIIGEITGYRCWRLKRGFLQSLVVDHIWEPGEIQQASVKEYGLYAFRSQSLARTAIFDTLEHNLSIARPNVPLVLGRVDLWGSIVEGEKGYKGEFADVTAIDDIILPTSYKFLYSKKYLLKKLRRQYVRNHAFAS